MQYPRALFERQIRVGPPDSSGVPCPLPELIANTKELWSPHLFTRITIPALSLQRPEQIRLICVPLRALDPELDTHERLDGADIAFWSHRNDLDNVPPEAALRCAAKMIRLDAEAPPQEARSIFFFTPNWPTGENLMLRHDESGHAKLHAASPSRRGYRRSTYWVFRTRS